MQAIIQLPHYLEHIKVGRRDLPVVLLPILNELRSARGEPAVSETALFSPVISPILSSARANQGCEQPRVLTVGAQSAANAAKRHLAAVAKQRASGRQTISQPCFCTLRQNNVWPYATGPGLAACLAFSEWLEQQQHVPSSARQLLRQLDSLLKDGIEQGAVATQPPRSR